MKNASVKSSAALGMFLLVGMVALGFLLNSAITNFRMMDRTVTVKGLSEREVSADVAVWPVRFQEADNGLVALSMKIEASNQLIIEFLTGEGFRRDEISIAAPAIQDRQANAYGDAANIKFRFIGSSTITVYSANVDLVVATAKKMVELAKQGVAITNDQYSDRTQFLFQGLNDIKPEMIEEATRNAREAAERFAKDSGSSIGRIKKARQGQFTISARDEGTPHIKRVRVVTTVDYFLTD
jgi:hypothetical protein